MNYLENLPYAAEPNCQPNHYYMLNNTNPGYLPNGALSGAGNVPPSPVRTIGDALIERTLRGPTTVARITTPWRYRM